MRGDIGGSTLLPSSKNSTPPLTFAMRDQDLSDNDLVRQLVDTHPIMRAMIEFIKVKLSAVSQNQYPCWRQAALPPEPNVGSRAPQGRTKPTYQQTRR